MPPGVRLRRPRHSPFHSSPAWSHFRRALAFVFVLSPLLFWLNSHLSIWAQPSAPQLLFSEIHPMPKAVDAIQGEWIEIANPSADAVNLFQWSIGNAGNGEILIPKDLIVPAG